MAELSPNGVQGVQGPDHPGHVQADQQIAGGHALAALAAPPTLVDDILQLGQASGTMQAHTEGSPLLDRLSAVLGASIERGSGRMGCDPRSALADPRPARL